MNNKIGILNILGDDNQYHRLAALKGDEGKKIIYCNVDGYIGEGLITYNTSDVTSYFPNGEPVIGDMIFYKNGIVGNVTNISTTNSTKTVTTHGYANMKGESGSGSGDMSKSVYDANNNGIVDNAEKVNNHTVNSDVPANAVFTDTTYTAGTGIEITNGVISNTQTSAEWGNITGTLSSQTDLKNALDEKADSDDIPTKTSDLTNDSGFLTSHQDISGKLDATNYAPHGTTIGKEIEDMLVLDNGFMERDSSQGSSFYKLPTANQMTATLPGELITKFHLDAELENVSSGDVAIQTTEPQTSYKLWIDTDDIDNVQDDKEVIISATQPTESNNKLWVKYSRNLIGNDTKRYQVDLKAGDKIFMGNTGSTQINLNLYTNPGDTTRNDNWTISANSTRVVTLTSDTRELLWTNYVDGNTWITEGATPTTYEPYVTPSIYIKVDGEYKTIVSKTIYSTNETFTGNYWIDGKKIYSKTIIKTDTISSNETNIPHNVSNIGDYRRVKEQIYYANGEAVYQETFDRDLQSCINVRYINNSNINVICGSNWLNAFIKSIYVLEYTKTTD